jgi:hypothetical protein
MSTVVVSNLSPELEAVARRLVATIEAGDMDGWLAAYADDGVIWHSHDGLVVTAAHNTEQLRVLFAEVISELRYDDIRRHQIDGGYVEQHTLRMTA